jgi:hypothetical protein
MPQYQETLFAKSFHKKAILAKPNVVGVGVGYKTIRKEKTDELSVIALVREKVPLPGLLPEALVPSHLDGIKTDVMEVGELRPLQSRTDRWRPAPPGISIGHFKITAGTFGAVVRDKSSGRRLILSNNHVLANSNAAKSGDPILQPGPVDGGRVENDTIARLERFYPLDFGLSPPTCSLARTYVEFGNRIARMAGSSHQLELIKSDPEAVNLIDAAVARPVENSQINDEILGIGEIIGVQQASLSLPVRKSGRTTGLRSGEVRVLDTTVHIEYGAGRTAVFEGQILTSPISQGGDSGSLLVTADSNHAVGLLFAGSSQATLHNPIRAVMEGLNIDFVSQKEISKKLEVQTEIEKARAVRAAYQDMLLAKANVVGVGVGFRQINGHPTPTVALIVTVKEKIPRVLLAPDDLIPTEIDGIPVDVVEVGELKAQ